MKDLIVVDDFYKEPDLVRDFALSLEYEYKSTPNYPGYQSKISCLSESVIDKFESILGEKINLSTSRKQMGYFRYILQSGKSRLKVHTDMTDWTVLVYLSSKFPNAIQAGTNLYQHKKTGLLGPPDNDTMLKMGYKKFNE